MFFKIVLLFTFLCMGIGLSGQTTIWSEDFSSYANGVLAGNGTGTSSAAWTSENGAPVNGGRILATDTDAFGSSAANPLVWSTASIDISAFSSVTFSLDVAAFNVGNLENSDNFEVAYSLNGGATWIIVFSDSGSASEPIDGSYARTFSGTTLEIRATFHNTFTNENYGIDNILVTGINDMDGDGIEDSLDNCIAFFNPIQADGDGDGVGDFCDLDDDNDGILDADECTSPVAPAAKGPNLVLNAGFEEGYRYWTSDFNRGSNNYSGGGGVPDTSGSCGTQGWIAVSPFSSTNGLCNQHYDYFGGEPDGSQLIIDVDQTGDNIYNETSSSGAGSCINALLPDHTTGTGNSVYIDPNNLTGQNYWEQTVYGIEANTNYYFSAFIMVIENTPTLSFNIDGVQELGPVTLTRQTGGSNGPDVWQEVAFIWNSGVTTGAIDLSISNEIGGCGGNDLRLDDITFAANLTDSDSDGMADCLDNDIDGDGCWDALEGDGGILLSQINEFGQITGGVDANGVPLLALGGQSNISGLNPIVFGAECADSDNDLIIDLIDLDDDNDGILDSIEDPNTDGDNNPVTNSQDTDGDGVADHIDLDSDNDGIYDVVEAGHDEVQASGRLTAAVGTDGVPDSAQNPGEEDSGLINYTVQNSDSTGLSDFVTVDSDGDGCNDVNEAGYTESGTDTDELQGTGYNITNGLVTGNADGYTTPADGDTNTVFDFREIGLVPNITIEPIDKNIFIAENTTFAVIADNVNIYQWQIFDGVSWVDLTNTGIHGGVSTATLTITNVSLADNGNQYRALTSSTTYRCNTEISNPVTLTVRVRTVITNRRITNRVKKN